MLTRRGAMAGIPDHILERIREQTDIVEVVGRHVGLKKSGKQWKGLCPFHEERSPSFYVDPVRRSFKCFGCGAWGDVFDFLQKVEGVGFLSAVRSLGARVGVALPDQDSGDVARAEQREREREVAYQINAAAADFYRDLLLHHEQGRAGREYQSERHIADETSEAFKIGYAPAPSEAGWDLLVRDLQQRNLPLPAAEQLGLIVRSPRGNGWYDRFRGRLMFPIIQPGGRVLGFSGRILPSFAESSPEDGKDGQKAPKYVNSPESALYKKARTLFGLHAAGNPIRERERAILVEGQIDVVSMHGRGYPETVASLGTALTKPQCELLARFTDRVVLCYDGDRAGVKASYAALPVLLEQGMDVRIAALDVNSLGRQLGQGPNWNPTHGEDPDSAIPDLLGNLLARPRPAILWFVDRAIDKGALQSAEAKDRALRALVPLISSVKSTGARHDYIGAVASMLQCPLRQVWAAVEGAASSSAGADGYVEQRPEQRPRDSARVSQFSAGMPHSAAMRPQPLPRAQADVTRLLVERPELSRVAQREGAIDYVTDPRLRPILERVIWAATEGEPMPSEGELLELIDPTSHKLVHDCLAPDHEKLSYSNAEDPGAALRMALSHCRREELQAEREQLLTRIAAVKRSGDEDAARTLHVQYNALGIELQKLAPTGRR
jgi:DNA primase